MYYKYIMSKKIYLLVILSLVMHYSFGQQLTNGKDSVVLIISRFGQLMDMSAASGAAQSNVRPVEWSAAKQFARLFKAITVDIDINRSEADSLVIVSILDPNIGIFECYTTLKDTSIRKLNQMVDTCLNSKKTRKDFPKLSVNQFIDTVFKYYKQTYSNISENDILTDYESVRRVHRKRYQVVAEASLKDFKGSFAEDFLPIFEPKKEYKYQSPDLEKGDQLPLKLRFFVSYDVGKIKEGKWDMNFKIDSVTLMKNIDEPPQRFPTKSRGFLDPFIGYGLSFPILNYEDAKYNELTKDNSVMLIGGLNATFFFNDRRFSNWDVGFTTGISYKSLRSNYSLESYLDTVNIKDDYTAQQLGGEYDLYVDAGSLSQHNRINALEVPLLFAVNYNFNEKKTLGLYGRIGGLFGLVLDNSHEMTDGSVTYTGHVGRLIGDEYIDYYFNSDIPEYGFSTYEADAEGSTELELQDYFIGGRLNAGIFGMNKIKTVGWHIGTFFDMDFTNLLDSDHQPVSEITRGKGHMNSFYNLTDELLIHNWGIEFGITIQLFHEHFKF